MNRASVIFLIAVMVIGSSLPVIVWLKLSNGQFHQFVSLSIILDDTRGYEELKTWLDAIDSSSPFGNFTFVIEGSARSYWIENHTRLETLKAHGVLIPKIGYMATHESSWRRTYIDTIIDYWVDNVSYSPRGFFDFQPDTFSVNYLSTKNVSYVQGSCFEQYMLDYMTMRGGWQLPYYANLNHVNKPNDREGGVVILPHVTFDWVSSLTVSHCLNTHPDNLLSVFKGSIATAQSYFYKLIDRTLKGCTPFGFVSIQFEWAWAGLDGGIKDFVKDWITELLTVKPYQFWKFEDIVDWFRATYEETPVYRVKFNSPYDNSQVEWFYSKDFRIARVEKSSIRSYVKYDSQEPDSYLDSYVAVNMSEPTSPCNQIDNSLHFTIDALGGGLSRAPVSTADCEYTSELSKFPLIYARAKASFLSRQAWLIATHPAWCGPHSRRLL